ncbi:MAG: VWA domain-containing protein [Spirochaetia bacterium]|nr:VWA domain-containing protein [Spirochaetia bacterium]
MKTKIYYLSALTVLLAGFALNCQSPDEKETDTRQVPVIEKPTVQKDNRASAERNEPDEVSALEDHMYKAEEYKMAEEAPAAPAQTYSRNKKSQKYKGMPAVANSGYLTAQQRYNPNFNTESYDRIYENGFLDPEKNALSTFSVDVDTASYSNTRRFLNMGSLPPKDAVRIEEFINYFSYDYENAPEDKPFSVSAEVSKTPWNPKHKLVHIGIKGREIQAEKMPPRNLVFLLDVSGSMSAANKLPLLKKSMKLLVNQLDEKDSVAIVVYAGASGLVLPPTEGSSKQTILDALEKLNAGGSTNGGQGIELAYKTAEEMMKKNGINRVILATDGDFNVGVTGRGGLTRLIEEKRKTGIFLTVLGFGMGNYKDSSMESLADKGNGNYAYIDNFNEAKKVLVNEAGATLVTIAKDVKIQVEFNPALVQAYRLIGYENRALKDEDFNDDKKDAGEIGAGHTVTALYEIVPHGVEINAGSVDPLKYQKPSVKVSNNKELMTVKLRYKEPDKDSSKLLSFPVNDSGVSFENSSENFRFSSAVAMYGMLLRDSEYKGKSNYDLVYDTARSALGKDEQGLRAEFLRLVKLSQGMSS